MGDLVLLDFIKRDQFYSPLVFFRFRAYTKVRFWEDTGRIVCFAAELSFERVSLFGASEREPVPHQL